MEAEAQQVPESVSETIREIVRGAVDVISQPELVQRLMEGRPLRVKAGFDPTRPDLHLGHVVLMNKLRAFQEHGHTVIFIVGDFTAQVGDPTGKNKTRPPVTREEVLFGARTYAEQAFKVLDPARTETRHNSEWLDRLTPQDFIRLAAKRTVARTMERRDFRERYESGRDIYLHELLYPLLQGYDSVAVDADIELGGTDQLFNLTVGRDLMTAFGKRPQLVMTTPLLEGLDARVVDGTIVGEKMSKSADNYVGITEAPAEMYRKLAGVNDGVVWRYYELLSARTTQEIATLRGETESGALPPREAQRRFAREMVARFHGSDAVEAAEARYEAVRAGQFEQTATRTVHIAGTDVQLYKAVVEAGLASTGSEAQRMVQGGGLQVGGARATDPRAKLATGTHLLVKTGKNRVAVTVVVGDAS